MLHCASAKSEAQTHAQSKGHQARGLRARAHEPRVDQSLHSTTNIPHLRRTPQANPSSMTNKPIPSQNPKKSRCNATMCFKSKFPRKLFALYCSLRSVIIRDAILPISDFSIKCGNSTWTHFYNGLCWSVSWKVRLVINFEPLLLFFYFNYWEAQANKFIWFKKTVRVLIIKSTPGHFADTLSAIWCCVWHP